MLKKILIGFVIVVGLGVLGAGTWFLIVTQDLPSEKELANYEPPITSRVHAGDGKLVAEFASEHRVYVPSEEIPDKLVHAFISAEDKTFFEHSGINLWGMFRGVVLNPLMGRSQAGGSTITQQVVKNMLVGNERSVDRKVREAVLAMRIETQLSKDEILELYMNEIYLGGRSYGVGAAALNYFGKSLSELTLAESALLAALPQAPGRVNPYNNPDAAVDRRNWVLDRMAINGFIDTAAADEAKGEALTTVARLNSDEVEAASYYVEELRREILRLGKADKLDGFGDEKAAQKAFWEGGLSIRSTLDTNLQLAAQTALRAGLETYDRRHGWRGPVGRLVDVEDVGQALKDFARSDDGKKAIAGMGSSWQLAIVKSGREPVKLAFAEGPEGTLASVDVKWAAAFKRDKGTGLQAGDVIMVARDAPPDVGAENILSYAARPRPASNAPWRIRQVPQLEGALIAMDPHTGRVFAMAGGYSFSKSEYNRAIQAMRQPGSSFKTFVYAAAMENGWTPSHRVLDAPYVWCDATQEKCYKPSNYSQRFYGMSTLRFGIEKSMNMMTLRLAGDIGLDKMSEIGERLGIYDKLPAYVSMSLGAGETTPMRMVTAYATLVNGGKQVKPVLLDRIQNRYGETVFKMDDRPCESCVGEWRQGLTPPSFEDGREQLMDPVTAYQMVSILEGTVERGTAGTARAVGKPLGAKTGTTNDFIDAWTVGFSPDLVVGVWVGFDRPRSMGEGESGGRLTAPIFRDFMMVALKDKPALPFRVPEGVRLVEVDVDTGCLPSPGTRLIIVEAFKPGTEPMERCAAGGYESEGYAVDYSSAVAGDEMGAAPVDAATGATVGEFVPPADATTGFLGQAPVPGDPAIESQPPEPQGELTIRDGVF